MLVVISGAQTGVDRAALDAAIDTGHVDPKFMGWCPKGRRASDGRVPDKYVMREHDSAAYPPRTKANILEADATLILNIGKPTGGTALTLRYCRELRKPHTHINLGTRTIYAESNVARWLRDNGVQKLNVAGPSDVRLHGEAYWFVYRVLQII